MSKFGSKFNDSKDYNTEMEKISQLFIEKKLDTYNHTILSSFSENSITKLVTLINSKISVGPSIDNKNYKLSYYEPYVKFISVILDKYVKNEFLFKIIKESNLLSTLTILPTSVTFEDKNHKLFEGGGIVYLKKYNSILTLNKKNLNENHLLITASSKGNLPTFLFWKTFFGTDMTKDESSIYLEQSIKNSDNRIFKWYISQKNINLKKTSVITNMLSNILSSSTTPSKYILKKIKILSENVNLIPYYSEMISYTSKGDIIYQLIKYYYKVPMDIENINNILKIDDLTALDAQKIFELIKTPQEKTLLIVGKILEPFNVVTKGCSSIYKSFIDSDIDYKMIIENLDEYINQINMILSESSLKSLNDIFNAPCACGKKCLGNLLSKMAELNIFHKINFHKQLKSESNKDSYYGYYKSKNSYSIPIQLLTKFYPITLKYVPTATIQKQLYVNKILSFLRVVAKRRSKTKILCIKTKYLPLMEELMNYKPTNKPVLKNGSINWQYQKQKFTNLPPRNLLPNEINIYKNFLLREKADGILLNNLPLNIEPKCEDIFVRQVKAEYVEDLDLYLIFDIELPNTNILNRYEFLRSKHSYTINKEIVSVSNIAELTKAIEEERKVFKKFLDDTKDIKNRWYPKVSFLVEEASNEFKKELISEIINNNDSRFCKFINNEGIYQCDGIIIAPLSGLSMRDIKMKPKKLMTIDLLFDGNNWLDKEKKNYNYLIKINDIKSKINKIYRCYPENNFYEPREIRFDKKYPNSGDIVNQIMVIYKYKWDEDFTSLGSYYHLNKKPILNQNHIKELEQQTDMLRNQLQKMLPENGKTWLDLGCGKGKLTHYIKKYNPKKYVGLDIDEQLLLNNIHIMDDLDWIKFSPCNLRTDWNLSKWFSIKNMKFDYIVLNFSLMHLFDSEDFWTQLNDVCGPNTKILFNVVADNIKTLEYKNLNAYMKYDNDKVIYYFPWSQSYEISENFISKSFIEEKVRKYNFLIDSYENIGTDTLVSKYDWYIIEKQF
jgi:SAM-dependent methyltransferase